MSNMQREPCSNMTPRAIAAFKGGKLQVKQLFRNRPLPLTEGGLFPCVKDKCYDINDQRQQRRAYLHRHPSLPRGSRPPLKAYSIAR